METKTKRLREEQEAPQGTISHSTENRLTLHGASAYTPRSIGLHSTEHRATLHGA
ncbi:MAG: hypothetical protein IKO60_03350 [Bacteroidaceae bacterium]|nr:hypothetical protein [Bacteroidaceae bacterium]